MPLRSAVQAMVGMALLRDRHAPSAGVAADGVRRAVDYP